MNFGKQKFIKKMTFWLLAASIMSSCNQKETKKTLVTYRQQRQTTATDSIQNRFEDDFIPAKQAASTVSNEEFIVIPSFEVEVKLSEAAEEKLKREKETIIVGADFSGIPKDKSSDYYRHLGWIEVASASKEISNSRHVVFDNVKYSKAMYDSLAEKDIRVNIYVVSGRKSSEDNLLDTDLISEKMSRAKGKKFVITGKLIREITSTEIK